LEVPLQHPRKLLRPSGGTPGRRALFAAVGLAAAVALAVALAVERSAIAGPSDTVPSTVAKVETPSAATQLPAWMQKMAGSSAELGTYIGSGSFYSGGYHDPYVSTSLYVRPTLDLGTRYKLAASARLYAEEEFTLPDNPNGRRFNPYDGWLSLVARNLHTFEAPKLVVGGVLRAIIPISYESRYANLLLGLVIGPTFSREFEFGSDPAPERRFKLSLTFIELFTKYLRSRDIRGNSPGASSGCQGNGSAGLRPGSVAPSGEGPPVGSSDTCGGPVNSSFGLRHAFVAALARDKLSLSLTLLIDNSFLYDVPRDAATSENAVDRGRSDLTWGVVAVSYALTDHLSANLGLSSLQPALDSQSRNLRFPFFDLSGGANANNYTQLFVSLTGSI
jgi:hypothetical protein